jgi:hypothetical protein
MASENDKGRHLLLVAQLRIRNEDCESERARHRSSVAPVQMALRPDC